VVVRAVGRRHGKTVWACRCDCGAEVEATLAALLAGRGVPCGCRPDRPPLTVDRILAWADEHRRCTGRWPSAVAGPVAGAPGENWRNLNEALVQGYRGLPGGSSLARLLAERRGRPRRTVGPPLTVGQILGWAEQHLRRTGRWPTTASGPVADEPGENWRALNMALWKGHRGLPRGGSLARLLREHRKGTPGPTVGAERGAGTSVGPGGLRGR
jgi:hypothetical protein